VSIEPSNMVRQAIFVGVNDHFTLTPATDSERSRDFGPSLAEAHLESTAQKIPVALEILQSQWHASNARADLILKSVIKLSRSAR